MMNAAQSNAGIASMGPMLAKMGRYEDTQVAHVAPGEVVVPRQLMESNPELRQEVMNAFGEVGVDPAQFIVGGDVVMKNPVTGIQEFGLFSKLKKVVKKLAPVVLPMVLSMTPLGPVLGAGLGSAVDRALRGDNLSDVLKAGATGAAVGGITQLGSNLMRGTKGGYMPNTTASATGPARGLDTEAVKKTAEAAGKAAGEKASAEILKVPSVEVGAPGAPSYVPRPDLEAAKQAADLAEKQAFRQSITEQTMPKAGSENFFGQKLGEQTKRVMFDTPTSSLVDAGIGTMKYTAKNPLQAAAYANIVGSAFVDEPPEQTPGMTDAEYAELMAQYEREVQAMGYKPTPLYFANGGITNMMDGGFTQGPGTGTSDSIPAYLSDGEFVMTAKAVEGAGNGDPKQGAAKMYAMMDKFERMA